MYIGLDFGTTHSGAALFDGERVHLFALDPHSGDPAVMRSTLYIPREGQISFGREAIDDYYRQNVGHPSKMVRQYVGEIEIDLSDVGSVKGYPAEITSFVQDVYVIVDEWSPGRLLHSLKSGLATGYEGTTIFGRYYTLEELIALYLRAIRERVEAERGEVVEGIVLGRPVHFVESGGEADDHRAEERLRHAAHEAGFRHVAFELEPIAAALYYELAVREPQHIVVFDLGGGTLDITVMRIGQPGRRQVFATGGTGIAGETFDRRMIEGLLLNHFGRGSTWGEDARLFPNQYTDALVNWQTVPELNKPETLRFLRAVRASSSHPKQIRALQSLLVNNYAIRMFDEVERAKIALSSSFFDSIQLQGEDLDVWQPVTRSQFESLIAGETQHIEECLLDTLHRSGLSPSQIDAAVRTGGSAQIPYFIEMLGRIFGPDKVVGADAFSSVVAGLAVRAWLAQAPDTPDRVS
jgi:hypothetical chaperone protein